MQKITKLIKVYEILGSARSLCNVAMIKAGFTSADETASAGRLVGIGGLVLGAGSVVQGIGNFKQAEGIAKATQLRNDALDKINKDFKPRDLHQDLTVEVEALEEPSISRINHNTVIEVEENALCEAEEALSAKQLKNKDRVAEVKDSEEKQKIEERKNKKIKLENKEYETHVESEKAKSGKFQAIGAPGQAAYYVAQGLSEQQKATSQKEGLMQQVQQDNQNQQSNTADGIKREIDKLADFDPFQRNSSSQR